MKSAYDRHVDDIVNEVEFLRTECDRLRKALSEVVYACRTKISMKEVARKALFPQKEDYK